MIRLAAGTLREEVIATRKTVLKVRSLRGQLLRGSKGVHIKKVKTKLRFHSAIMNGDGGKR